MDKGKTLQRFGDNIFERITGTFQEKRIKYQKLHDAHFEGGFSVNLFFFFFC